MGLLHSQGGDCAVCRGPLLMDGLVSLGDTSEKCVVDHDHVTGKIRGLLHGRCNLVLGNAGDRPDILRAAAEYLEKHR